MEKIFSKALNLEFLSLNEALDLYNNASITDLMVIANKIRNKLHPNNIVGWQIDRNVNITNSCIAQCSFAIFTCIQKLIMSI